MQFEAIAIITDIGFQGPQRVRVPIRGSVMRYRTEVVEVKIIDLTLWSFDVCSSWHRRASRRAVVIGAEQKSDRLRALGVRCSAQR